MSIPVPPPELRYLATGRVPTSRFEQSGLVTIERIRQALALAGRHLEEFRDILDFGCGCGRVSRWIVRLAPDARLSGSDIAELSVAWVREYLPQMDARVNGNLPPLSFPPDSFDLIIGWSVFTHLNSEYQDAWLAELRRVARPNALVLLSIHGRRAWEAHVPKLQGLKLLSGQLDEDGILFVTSEGWSEYFPDHFHTTFHRRSYIESHWSRWFEVVQIHEGERAKLQDLVVLRKPGRDERDDDGDAVELATRVQPTWEFPRDEGEDGRRTRPARPMSLGRRLGLVNDAYRLLVFDPEDRVLHGAPPTTGRPASPTSRNAPDVGFLRSFLQPGMNAVLAGHAEPSVVLESARSVGSGGRVLVLEPGYARAMALWGELDRAGIEHVQIVRCAASERTGFGPVLTGDDGEAGDQRSALQASRLRLDDLLSLDAPVDLLRIDARGHEHQLLRGAIATITRWQPVVLVWFSPVRLRQDGVHPLDVLGFYHSLGFEILRASESHDAWSEAELIRLSSTAPGEADDAVPLVLMPRMPAPHRHPSAMAIGVTAAGEARDVALDSPELTARRRLQQTELRLLRRIGELEAAIRSLRHARGSADVDDPGHPES